jgi:hypothetical protein
MSISAVRTVCGSSARTGLCGGRSAMTVPTAIDPILDSRFWILDWDQGDQNMTKTYSIRLPASSSDNPKSAIQKRPRRPKWVGLLAFVLAFTLCGAVATAQQPGKIFRIGFLDGGTAAGSAVLVEAFRQELSKLGWIEGKNIAIDYRFAEQRNERMPELAADLV